MATTRQGGEGASAAALLASSDVAILESPCGAVAGLRRTNALVPRARFLQAGIIAESATDVRHRAEKARVQPGN
jgi:hypothetical protein